MFNVVSKTIERDVDRKHIDHISAVKLKRLVGNELVSHWRIFSQPGVCWDGKSWVVLGSVHYKWELPSKFSFSYSEAERLLESSTFKSLKRTLIDNPDMDSLATLEYDKEIGKFFEGYQSTSPYRRGL